MNHFCPIPVADRAHALDEGAGVRDQGTPLDPEAAAALRRALLGGETHYTPRPGIPELQEEIGRRLEAAGAPPGGNVVITGGRQEALFVALAGARQMAASGKRRSSTSPTGTTEAHLPDANPDETASDSARRVPGRGEAHPPGPGRQRPAGEPATVLLSPAAAGSFGVFAAGAALELVPLLLPDSLAGGKPVRPAPIAVVVSAEEAAAGAGREVGRDTLPIVDCGGDLPVPERGLDLRGVPAGAVLIGSLDGLSELAPFRVGFFRAPEAVLVPLRTLKQAISICTPAPSQRAAALVLGARPQPPEPPPASPAAKGAGRDDSRYSLMELAARLDDVISLGRGDPDADAPAPVIETACASLAETEALDPRGQRWLRARIAAHEEARTGVRFDPDTEVLVTGGAQEGITLAMLALVGEREDVLLGDPRYTSYQQAIELAKGRMAPIPCGTGEDHLDFGLRAPAAAATLRRTARPRLLAIVNFSNPTGARTRSEAVIALCRLADRHHLWVLADEVYAAMPFDGEGPVLSPASLPGMKARTLTLGSVSKSYAMTGFRTGWITGPPDAIAACSRIKGALSGPTALFSQRAAAAALDSGDRWPARLREIYAPRRRLLLDGLAALDIPTATHGGGFFVWADISRFGLPAETFCRRLLLEARVLMFPGTAFGRRWDRFTRVSMLESEERIAAALARIHTFAGAAAG